jgi:hypothetical protein
MNNTAIIAKLGNITKIEGADNIVQASVIVNGIPLTTVVTGVDTHENTPVVYFDSNMSISQDFIESIDKQNPYFSSEGFKGLSTYLAKGNRVRAIKLRGCYSNGLAIELSKLETLCSKEEFSKLVEGCEFTEINGKEVCKKWLPVSQNVHVKGNKERKGNKKVSRIIPELFKFHVDTEQLIKHMHEISSDDVISISRKIHGTSAICSHTKVLKKLSFFDKVLQLMHVPVTTTEFDYLFASRSVIKNDALTTGFYKVDIWSKAGEENFKGKLHKGETIYYEIVGYLPNTGSFIQKPYDYGCKIGEYKIAVYRITQTNEDGIVFEHSWASMKDRCKELNVPMVQEFYFGRAKDLYPDLSIEEHWHQNFIANLRRDFLEKDCTDNLTKKVPDEGIVLRVEAKNIQVFKLKSEKFFAHESKAKDDETVDIEEQEVVNADIE